MFLKENLKQFPYMGVRFFLWIGFVMGEIKNRVGSGGGR